MIIKELWQNGEDVSLPSQRALNFAVKNGYNYIHYLNNDLQTGIITYRATNEIPLR